MEEIERFTDEYRILAEKIHEWRGFGRLHGVQLPPASIKLE